MNGAALIAAPGAGGRAVWRVVGIGQPPPLAGGRHVSRQLGALCLGLLATAACVGCVWQYARPDTVVRTRIVAEGAIDTASRAALSDITLRLAATQAPAQLQDGGDALEVAVQDHDPAAAERRSRSLVDVVLNAPMAGFATVAVSRPATPESGLRAERMRLAAAADALDARAATISATLAGIARDMAAAGRSAAERKPGRETLEKGEAALADLQLQRLQLASKYQDTYPAVVGLDGQIRNLRVFLMDEAHRTETHPATMMPSDALLAGERDRLRIELAQLDDRRGGLASQLSRIDKRLAAMPPAMPALPETVIPPILIAAATTSFATDDVRPALMAKVIAIGLFLSGVFAMLARRRPSLFAHHLVLNPEPAQPVALEQTSSLQTPPREAAWFEPIDRARLHRRF